MLFYFAEEDRMSGYEEIRKIIEEKIAESDLVLVGLGEEFECAKFFYKNPVYERITTELGEKEEYAWMLPYVSYLLLKDNEQLIKALSNLKKVLGKKNYFIVTTCMNEIAERAAFQENRITAPCGGFSRMQCAERECGSLIETPQTVLDEIETYVKEKKSLEEISIPCCSQCGRNMMMNNLYAREYLEEGYLEKWNVYTKWLQGTLNRKICVLELGVSLKYPTVIRFPFEKVAFFNQNAFFIRVHERLYQLSEELRNKSVSHQENAVDFLAHW